MFELITLNDILILIGLLELVTAPTVLMTCLATNNKLKREICNELASIKIRLGIIEGKKIT